MRSRITSIKLRKAKNSKGTITIKAIVKTHDAKAWAITPSGTSSGKHEAVFMPDKPDKLIRQANDKLIPRLIGLNVFDQEQVDLTMREADGTENFSRIGASITTAISTACLKAAAASAGKELYEYLGGKRMPFLVGKCIGGGAHAKKSTDFQEFLSIPLTRDVEKAVKVNKAMHRKVGRMLNSSKLDYEGGWVANITNEEALEVMSTAAEEVMRKEKTSIAIGIDIAASTLFNGEKYVYKDKELNEKEQKKYVENLVKEYDVYYVEDAFHEDDFKSFSWLTKKVKSSLIVGDDLFTTNKKRLEKGIKLKAGNSIIIKPNQVGTITDVFQTVKLAKSHDYTPVVSHRSGETKDAFIADLAVGLEAPLMKIGIIGKERTAKTSRLVKIKRRIMK